MASAYGEAGPDYLAGFEGSMRQEYPGSIGEGEVLEGAAPLGGTYDAIQRDLAVATFYWGQDDFPGEGGEDGGGGSDGV